MDGERAARGAIESGAVRVAHPNVKVFRESLSVSGGETLLREISRGVIPKQHATFSVRSHRRRDVTECVRHLLRRHRAEHEDHGTHVHRPGAGGGQRGGSRVMSHTKGCTRAPGREEARRSAYERARPRGGRSRSSTRWRGDRPRGGGNVGVAGARPTSRKTRGRVGSRGGRTYLGAGPTSREDPSEVCVTLEERAGASSSASARASGSSASASESPPPPPTASPSGKMCGNSRAR